MPLHTQRPLFQRIQPSVQGSLCLEIENNSSFYKYKQLRLNSLLGMVINANADDLKAPLTKVKKLVYA